MAFRASSSLSIKAALRLNLRHHLLLYGRLLPSTLQHRQIQNDKAAFGQNELGNSRSPYVSLDKLLLGKIIQKGYGIRPERIISVLCSGALTSRNYAVETGLSFRNGKRI